MGCASAEKQLVDWEWPQLRRTQTIAGVETLQPSYSMLMRDIESEVLQYCSENNIGVLAYSPLQNGLLTGTLNRERIARLPKTDWRINFSPAFREPHLTRSLRVVEQLRSIGARYARTPAEVAIAWGWHLEIAHTKVAYLALSASSTLLRYHWSRISEEK